MAAVPGGEPGDDDIDRHLRAVPDQAWAAIWDAHAAVAAEAEHIRWEGGGRVGTGGADDQQRPVSSLPYPVYSAATERLRRSLAALVVPFSWMDWDGVRRYRGGRGMADAPVADAVRIITAVLRSERFSDGSIAGALEDGTLPAAVERVRAWRARHRGTHHPEPS